MLSAKNFMTAKFMTALRRHPQRGGSKIRTRCQKSRNGADIKAGMGRHKSRNGADIKAETGRHKSRNGAS